MEKNIIHITGKCGRAKNFIWIDGVEIFPQPSLSLLNKSPDGFNWGYGGSGPAQTALAILLHALDNKYLALALYQQFKFRHVGAWPNRKHFEVDIDLTEFLNQHPKQVMRAKDNELFDVCNN